MKPIRTLTWVLVLTLLVLKYVQSSSESSVRYLTVKVNQGHVMGYSSRTIGDREFFSFMSIPYAKSPTGNLRLKDPVEADSWVGILNATKMPDRCPQFGFYDYAKDVADRRVFGTEDCLYLNVYTTEPNFPTAKLPVMVYIHGGGFYAGGATEYTPHLLLNGDIVLVVIQYRLGLLGFLSTEDSVIPGNFGLKDQQLALKWVQKNIAQFGGNPQQVTLFGESAGSAAVHYQILSPGSKGLFHRAIMQSGTSLCPWASNNNHRWFATEVGKRLNCSLTEESESYLQCLQKLDVNELVKLPMEFSEWGNNPMYVLPGVDKEFLPDSPEVLLREGKYAKVPLISGITRDEGALILFDMWLDVRLAQNLNQNFSKYGPISLSFDTEDDAEVLSSKAYEYYVGGTVDKMFLSNHAQELCRLYSDRYFGMCHDIAAFFHSQDSDVPLYTYRFDHLGDPSLVNIIEGFDRRDWVVHGDDLFYLFTGGPLLYQDVSKKEDWKMRNLLISMWISFARTGNPTPPGFGFTWEKTTRENFQHLSLTLNPRMEKDYYTDIRKFWSSLKTKQNQRLNEEGNWASFKNFGSTEMKQEL